MNSINQPLSFVQASSLCGNLISEKANKWNAWTKNGFLNIALAAAGKDETERDKLLNNKKYEKQMQELLNSLKGLDCSNRAAIKLQNQS